MGSRIVTKSSKVTKGVKESTDWWLKQCWLPLSIKTSASCLFQLRSKVLQNHYPPQEVMNNILPLHELNKLVGLIYYVMLLFWGGCLMIFCVGLPIFLMIWNTLELIIYVFQIMFPNCKRWFFSNCPQHFNIQTPQFQIFSPSDPPNPLISLNRRERRRYQCTLHKLKNRCCRKYHRKKKLAESHIFRKNKIC